MWSDRLRTTGLTSPAADWFFSKEPGKIIIDDNRSFVDTTMLATLRYLLHDKVGNGNVRVTGYSTDGSMYGSSGFGSRIRRIYSSGNNLEDSYLLIIETSENAEEVKPDLESTFGFASIEGNLIKADAALRIPVPINGEEVMLDMKYQPSLTYFFGAKFGVYAFADVEHRITAVITSRLNSQKYHWLQAVIPMLMPWYWANETGKISIDKESLALLETLNSTDKDKYSELISWCADKLEIENKYNEEMLRGFLHTAQERSVDQAKSEIEGMRDRINDWLDSIGEYTRMINEKLAYITGVEASYDDTVATEFASYIRGNRAIKTMEFAGDQMKILCHGLVEYYNSDQMEELLKSRRSYVYSNVEGTALEGDKIAKLLKALFVDEVLRIRVCALYSINVGRNRVNGLSNGTYPSEFADYYPNPHIEHYACIGDYESEMAQYLRNGNYVGAVEQCIASAQTLNFFDSTVTGRMISDFVRCYQTRKCIMLPNGDFVTIKDALEYLDGQAQE